MYDAKKKNHTFNTSILEDEFAKYLTEHNYQFERQYKSELYPFNCDFYLNDYDLYIEINGSWTHGHHPFDASNKNDIDILNDWKAKSLYSDYYKNAIDAWTERDSYKQIVKENNLNYLVIYSNNIDDVVQQFNNFFVYLNHN